MRYIGNRSGFLKRDCKQEASVCEMLLVGVCALVDEKLCRRYCKKGLQLVSIVIKVVLVSHLALILCIVDNSINQSNNAITSKTFITLVETRVKKHGDYVYLYLVNIVALKFLFYVGACQVVCSLHVCLSSTQLPILQPHAVFSRRWKILNDGMSQ